MWSACLIIAISAAVLPNLAAGGEPAREAADEIVYLFSSFRGNGEDGLHLACRLVRHPS